MKILLFLFLIIFIIKSELLPPTHLNHNCFNWPAKEFDKHNYAKLEIIDEGKNAIDFELQDVHNRTVKLSSFSKNAMLYFKPVVGLAQCFKKIFRRPMHCKENMENMWHSL